MKTVNMNSDIKIERNLQNSIHLLPFSECINKKLYDMYQDIPKEEIGSTNKFFGLNYDDFEKRCKNCVIEENVINEKIGSTTKRFILTNGKEY